MVSHGSSNFSIAPWQSMGQRSKPLAAAQAKDINMASKVAWTKGMDQGHQYRPRKKSGPPVSKCPRVAVQDTHFKMALESLILKRTLKIDITMASGLGGLRNLI